MKKILGILVLGLLWCNISFANQEYRIKNFTQWLYENGHNQYLEKDSDGRLQTNLKILPIFLWEKIRQLILHHLDNINN